MCAPHALCLEELHQRGRLAIMYTVKQTATELDVSTSTVRTWSREFADHLSDTANPEYGMARDYTEDDIAVFKTVVVLRSQLKNFKYIRQALAAGERYEPQEAPEPTQEAPEATQKQSESESQALATIDMLERFVIRYEKRIDTLESQLEEEREARLKAETEAARLAGKLERRWRWPWQK